MQSKTITRSHGSGGTQMHELIRSLILKQFDNPALRPLADSAYIGLRGKCAFTSDSFVVSPLLFPGGDIGKLAVCGCVNDLAVMGARPLYLSVSFIIEEGLDLGLFASIVGSIARTARAVGAAVVTGDIKVVERGACDGLFISVSGIGSVAVRRELSVERIRPGDRIICTGDIGRHGFAVLLRRQGIDFGSQITSDCAALSGMLVPLARIFSGIKCMRDCTRGGVATTLHEFVEGQDAGIRIDEAALPVSGGVRVAAELLGIDPLYSANEGCACIVVRAADADGVLRRVRRHAAGRNARMIGTVTAGGRGRVILATTVGTERIVPMMSEDQLPRIC